MGFDEIGHARALQCTNTTPSPLPKSRTTALGETIAVVTVRVSQIEPLRHNEILHVRRLEEVQVAKGLSIVRTGPVPVYGAVVDLRPLHDQPIGEADRIAEPVLLSEY